MNWKLLLVPTTILGSALTLAVACQPCPEDGCQFDGFGGSDGTGGGSGGSASGGLGGETSSGGSTGGSAEGGADGLGGGAAELDCLENGQPTGTPGSCEPWAPEGTSNYTCQACAQQHCCAEVEACDASGPQTACYYGSTAVLGAGDEPLSELDCILQCLRDLAADDEFTGEAYQVDDCALTCGSTECDETQAGAGSVALAKCLVGDDENPAGCQEECGILEF